MTLEVVAAVVGIGVAALALSLLGLWRGVVAQAAVERTLREKLTAMEQALAAAAAPPPPVFPTETLTGIREDVSVLFNHTAALTAGQVTLQKSVDEALAPTLDEVCRQIADGDRRAIGRTETLRDEQQKLSEQIEALGAQIEAQVARLGGGGLDRAAVNEEIAPVLECAIALSEQIAALSASVGAAAPAGDPAAAREAAAAAFEQIAAELRSGLRQDIAAAVAEAARAAPQLAPRVFNTGRVVTLVAPRTAPEPASTATSGPRLSAAARDA